MLKGAQVEKEKKKRDLLHRRKASEDRGNVHVRVICGKLLVNIDCKEQNST